MLTGITLHHTPTSPFARRVRIALRRLTLAHDEVVVENLFPPPASFLALNPLGLVPTLVVAGREPIVDSSVILDFLDDHEARVWPKELTERWAAKRLSTLATGVLTDAVAWRLESTRGDARKETLAAREEAILRTVRTFAGLKQRHAAWWRKPNQALFDVGVALEYLAFRLPHLAWEEILAGTDDDLWEVLDEEPAFGETMPPGLERRV